jgi:DNA-binding NtrC family response regulator
MTDRQNFSILIVDDEEFVRHLLTSFLGSIYDCIAAENAEVALVEMKTRSVDLVLTDVTMPGISGLELCDILRQSHPQTPVLILSALGDGSRKRAALEHGAFDFIEKPFDLTRLLNVVNQALQSDGSQPTVV